ncbi:MAG: glycoside hydrolase family 32 protein, partial [Pseudomonadota bacterium]
GHATSRDLLSWTEHGVALEPDDLGWIFSGSVVVDHENRLNVQDSAQKTLVAFFTHHDAEAAKRNAEGGFQHQSMAYSLDGGEHWIKHSANPILPNPGGVQDFRDPYVLWHPGSSAWIMLVSAGVCVEFYRSTDLLNWAKCSTFDAGEGADAGVWECPVLCTVPVEEVNETRWVLIQSFMPGGRLGGSGTRYFIGCFDGYVFEVERARLGGSRETPDNWYDWGPDNYAANIWANLPPHMPGPVSIGWMNNWVYANTTKETPFRGQMTLPRSHSIRLIDDKPYLVSEVAFDGVAETIQEAGLVEERIRFDASKSCVIDILCDGEIAVRVAFDAASSSFHFDRKSSHPTGDGEGFAGQFDVPRISSADHVELSIWLGAYCIEAFIDDGLQSVSVLLASAVTAVKLTH